MDGDVAAAVVWIVVVVAAIVGFVRLASGGSGGSHSRPGAGTVGTVYDWLNEDKRKAVELIVEGRAEARDPEDKDGNLPDLEKPN